MEGGECDGEEGRERGEEVNRHGERVGEWGKISERIIMSKQLANRLIAILQLQVHVHIHTCIHVDVSTCIQNETLMYPKNNKN